MIKKMRENTMAVVSIMASMALARMRIFFGLIDTITSYIHLFRIL
jgi:hypothetical protein